MKNINAIVILSEFNLDIVKNLYLGVKKSFDQSVHVIEHKKIHVPGAFELTFMAKKIQQDDYKDKKLDFIITLGCIIKGESAHFEYISNACTSSIAHLNLKSHIPIMFGVITAYNKDQAFKRSEINFSCKENYNIGYEVANAAIFMHNSIENI